jgi:glutamate 5-kinase
MNDIDPHNLSVVKIGSSTLAHESGVNRGVMQNIVTDISALVKARVAHIVIVSSGSVRIGKSKLGSRLKGLKTGAATANQISSTVGQADLIHAYEELFKAQGLDIAQGLITRRDFSIRERYASMRDALLALLKVDHIIPILNDNDLLTDEEVEFTDNDQLAAYVTAMLDAQRLIILSDVEGLLDAPPRIGGKIIRRVTNPEDARQYLWWRRKKQSAGGMPSKIDTAILMGEFGIPMYLVNGRKPHVIERVLNGEEEGTVFESGTTTTSASLLQRWLRAGAMGAGAIELSTVIAQLLRNGRRASVLSIGIEEILRPFRKDEVVDVYDESGQLLGRGMAQRDSDALIVGDERQLDGQVKSPIVIHWQKFAAFQNKPRENGEEEHE